jgi:hypothetical protein
MFGIRQQQKSNLAFAIRRDLFGKRPAYIRRVNADRIKLYLFTILQKRA